MRAAGVSFSELEVRKMRGTPHSDHLSFFEIADGGIGIMKIEEISPLRKARKALKKKG